MWAYFKWLSYFLVPQKMLAVYFIQRAYVLIDYRVLRSLRDKSWPLSSCRCWRRGSLNQSIFPSQVIKVYCIALMTSGICSFAHPWLMLLGSLWQQVRIDRFLLLKWKNRWRLELVVRNKSRLCLVNDYDAPLSLFIVLSCSLLTVGRHLWNWTSRCAFQGSWEEFLLLLID